jgi:hypothetical protein
VVADAFKGVDTLSKYAEWMGGLANGILPGCSYTVHSLTWNPQRQVVVSDLSSDNWKFVLIDFFAQFFATFHGKHTGNAGPPPTGKETNAHYVYALQLNDENKIVSMTKVSTSLIFHQFFHYLTFTSRIMFIFSIFQSCRFGIMHIHFNN